MQNNQKLPEVLPCSKCYSSEIYYAKGIIHSLICSKCENKEEGITALMLIEKWNGNYVDSKIALLFTLGKIKNKLEEILLITREINMIIDKRENYFKVMSN